MMMTRTPLCERSLPDYTRTNEIANMVTHIVGGAIGVAVLVFAVLIAASHKNPWGVVSGAIYGASMIVLYSVSSVYHGLKPSMGKKVMQVIDHCTIYLLIVGTYTPILLSAIRPAHPAIAWVIFGAEWALAAFAAVFTAIDHKQYGKLSMCCYIGMGWLVVLALKPTLDALGKAGFLWLLAGGIAYTVGAIIYGLGKKNPTLHTVFHLFVDAGILLQAVCILKYVL